MSTRNTECRHPGRTPLGGDVRHLRALRQGAPLDRLDPRLRGVPADRRGRAAAAGADRTCPRRSLAPVAPRVGPGRRLRAAGRGAAAARVLLRGAATCPSGWPCCWSTSASSSWSPGRPCWPAGCRGATTVVGIVLALVGLALVLDAFGGVRVDVIGVAWGLLAAFGLGVVLRDVGPRARDRTAAARPRRGWPGRRRDRVRRAGGRRRAADGVPRAARAAGRHLAALVGRGPRARRARGGRRPT